MRDIIRTRPRSKRERLDLFLTSNEFITNDDFYTIGYNRPTVAIFKAKQRFKRLILEQVNNTTYKISWNTKQ